MNQSTALISMTICSATIGLDAVTQQLPTCEPNLLLGFEWNIYLLELEADGSNRCFREGLTERASAAMPHPIVRRIRSSSCAGSRLGIFSINPFFFVPSWLHFSVWRKFDRVADTVNE